MGELTRLEDYLSFPDTQSTLERKTILSRSKKLTNLTSADMSSRDKLKKLVTKNTIKLQRSRDWSPLKDKEERESTERTRNLEFKNLKPNIMSTSKLYKE